MFNINYYPQEIAEALYSLCEDMDARNHEETKSTTILELENAIYYLKAICENEYNNDFFRTFYKCLETITERN